MAKRLSVSVLVDIPADPFTAADIYKQLQPSWASLMEALKTCGTHYEMNVSEMEVRAKRGPRKKNKLAVVEPPKDAA